MTLLVLPFHLSPFFSPAVHLACPISIPFFPPKVMRTPHLRLLLPLHYPFPNPLFVLVLPVLQHEYFLTVFASLHFVLFYVSSPSDPINAPMVSYMGVVLLSAHFLSPRRPCPAQLTFL
eukprot:GILI01052351.1.p2 GENE.GILI01052351.1~~GILI01052351.1.p2  ORF type:complete len:119 (+),score=3.22 GILI01052351.1:494-850(+)